MSQPPGHDYRVPVPDALVKTMNEQARKIGAALPEGMGFALLIFDYNVRPDGEGRMLYISSAQRADMVKAMQEFIAKQANA